MNQNPQTGQQQFVDTLAFIVTDFYSLYYLIKCILITLQIVGHTKSNCVMLQDQVKIKSSVLDNF